ncbi:hypothetical protein DXG01_017060 [Tephrocybe rancida]|nr:hypothetical protein DXG01_017060 [Tephrocybe rancida]
MSLPGLSTILRYAGAPEEDRTPSPTSTNLLKEINLRGLAFRSRVARIMPQLLYHNRLHSFYIYDEWSYVCAVDGPGPPTGPHRSAQRVELVTRRSCLQFALNKVIELSLPGAGRDMGGPGHSIYLVIEQTFNSLDRQASIPSSWDKQSLRTSSFAFIDSFYFSIRLSGDNDTYRYLVPIQRDTVNSGLADGNATIRFVTNNARPWFLHCGLAIVFAEDIPDIARNNYVPDSWKTLCDSDI